MGIGISTLGYWQGRAENGTLENTSPIPITLQATELRIVKKVLNTHLSYPQWGGRKISEHLLNQKQAYVSPGTVQKIKNQVTILVKHKEQKRCLQYVTYYEALSPHDVWAIDFMQFDWYGETLYIPIIIDDHSRFVLGWEITSAPTTKLVLELLNEVITKHKNPVAIKSDNGPQFRNNFREALNLSNISCKRSNIFRDSILSVSRAWP